MYLGVSGHEGVHIVVDQLEDEASVHQVEAALQVEKEEVVSEKTKKHKSNRTLTPDLDEDCQAVVGVSGCVQIVLVLLGDVRHHHVDQRLHCVVEGRREALVPGQLQGGSCEGGPLCFSVVSV